MKSLINFILIFFIIGLVSCRDDFNFEPSTGNELAFSKDTVYLDTIFSNIGSSTYQLKVYNRSKNDIQIPKIHLKKGENSKFRLSVDGFTGKSFENIELLAEDSLFVFIETTVDISEQTQEKDFLYTDELVFQSLQSTNEVQLVTLVKDAHFLYPQRYSDQTYESIAFNDEQVYGFFLDENDEVNGNELQWNNEKPYVIYGYAAVPPGKTLTISEGTDIHFHAQSGLLVFPTAELLANGTIDNPIIVQGNRLEPYYEDIPGQWGMIFIGQNSKADLKNMLIKNATYGLYINTNSQPVTLENIQVYNCTDYGIVGQAASINAKNVVTNNIGRAALALTYGGNYEFNHCTFANYWNRAGHTAVLIDNSENYPLQATFKNSIIHSASPESLIIATGNEQSASQLYFDYCLIKFFDTSNQLSGNYPYEFSNASVYNQCLIAKYAQQYPPYFKNVTKNQLMPTDQATSIIGYGSIQNAQQVPNDIQGFSRVSSPDLGAYQHVINTDE